MIQNNINSFYLLPPIEPCFYNDIINIENVPIFNDLKNNFNEIKQELISNFSLFSNVEKNDYLYSELGMYVKSKDEGIGVENTILAYSLQLPDFSSDNIDELNDQEKEKINIILNLKNIKVAAEYNSIVSGKIDNFLIENKLEKLSLEEKEDINLMIKLKRMSPLTSNIIKNLQDQKILTTCLVSKLKPNSYITPHKDPMKENILRVHYCLVNDDNCNITVGDETRQWIENDFLIFNPYGLHRHSVNHDGTKDRTVLIFDLKRSYLEQYFK
jgi:hypothetical protein